MRFAPVLLALLCATPAFAIERVAVLEFAANPPDAVDGVTLSALSDEVRRAAVDVLPAARFSVMTKENQETVLREYGVDAQKMCDAACEVDLARTIGAAYLVTGAVNRIGSRLSLHIKIFHAERGQVLKIVKVTGSVDEIYDQAYDEARTLFLDGLGLAPAAAWAMADVAPLVAAPSAPFVADDPSAVAAPASTLAPTASTGGVAIAAPGFTLPVRRDGVHVGDTPLTLDGESPGSYGYVVVAPDGQELPFSVGIVPGVMKNVRIEIDQEDPGPSEEAMAAYNEASSAATSDAFSTACWGVACGLSTLVATVGLGAASIYYYYFAPLALASAFVGGLCTVGLFGCAMNRCACSTPSPPKARAGRFHRVIAAPADGEEVLILELPARDPEDPDVDAALFPRHPEIPRALSARHDDAIAF